MLALSDPNNSAKLWHICPATSKRLKQGILQFQAELFDFIDYEQRRGIAFLSSALCICVCFKNFPSIETLVRPFSLLGNLARLTRRKIRFKRIELRFTIPPAVDFVGFLSFNPWHIEHCEIAGL